MKNNLPSVSVIIAARNEEKFISKCLDSIISNTYPEDMLEVLVVDGMSSDRTREITEGYARKYPFIKILKNKNKYTPHAFNIGIKNAKGEIILIGGAHAVYEKEYISKCVRYLNEYDADNVGGALKTVPSNNSIIAGAIADCLSSSFGAGGSVFRLGSKKPQWVDTVFGGCYKKEVFERIGLFNENLLGSHDMEFNLRLKKAGGKILLAPDIIAYYYPSSALAGFFSHNIEDGIWAVLPLKFIRQPLKLRHYIPLFFILTLPLSIWPYIPANLFFSMKTALEKKDIRYFFAMPAVFLARHIGYGFGSLLGIFKLIFY